MHSTSPDERKKKLEAKEHMEQILKTDPSDKTLKQETSRDDQSTHPLFGTPMSPFSSQMIFGNKCTVI